MAVKKEFIIEVMRELNHKYFVVLTPSYDVVYLCMQNGIVLEESIKRLQKFFDSSEAGMYVVKIFDSNETKKNGDPVKEGLTYEIILQPSLKEPTPIQGLGQQNPMAIQQMDNGFLDRFLSSKDDIAGLRVQFIEQGLKNEKDAAIAQIRKEYEDKIRELEKKDGITGILQSLIPEFAPHIMGMASKAFTKTPIAGLGDDDADKKKMIISAINILTSLDPDFAENITKLAELAQKNPAMYTMGINAINKM